MIINKILFAIFGLITISAITSCQPKNINQNIHDIWALEMINNVSIKTQDSKRNKRPVLEINTTKMKVFGNDGCNNYSGAIAKLEDNKIEFGPLMGTKMACPDMKTSNEYNLALGNVKSFQNKGLKLLLMDKSNNVLLVFQKVD